MDSCVLPALTLCTLHGGIKRNCQREQLHKCVSGRNVSYHRCSEVIDFQNTDGLDRSFISILLKLLQTGRNNISRHKKNQKGQKSNSDSYLSLLVLIFCRHALKPLPQPLAKTDTGLTAAFMGCVPHVAHITVSQMVHDFSFQPPSTLPPLPSLVSPHHFIQHLALWGRLQAPVEVCVAARCNTSLRRTLRKMKTDCAGRFLRLSSPRCSSCINICPQLGRMQEKKRERKGSPFHLQEEKGLVLCFVFLCMVGNGCTRAWRRWCTAAWKEFAPAVTSWYKNSCDSWLFCTRFGRTTVTLKIHTGLILDILSSPPVSSVQ